MAALPFACARCEMHSFDLLLLERGKGVAPPAMLAYERNVSENCTDALSSPSCHPLLFVCESMHPLACQELGKSACSSLHNARSFSLESLCHAACPWSCQDDSLRLIEWLSNADDTSHMQYPRARMAICHCTMDPASSGLDT